VRFFRKSFQLLYSQRSRSLPEWVYAAIVVLGCTPCAGAAGGPSKWLHTERLIQMGYQGQGIRVGVISGGALNYSRLARQGVLPAELASAGPRSDEGDEGDWMMQVVHQIAPRAVLGFCAAQEPDKTVACARELVSRFHADIVVDDLNPQPVYTHPTVKATGLAELARQYPQVLFFTGAGNNGGGYYEGPWTPAELVVNGASYLAQDFGRSLGTEPDPYNTFALESGEGVTVLLGTSGSPEMAANSGASSALCEERNFAIRLVFLDVNGALLSSTESRCTVSSLAYRNREHRPQQVRLAVLLPEGGTRTRFGLKVVALRQAEGVSPLALTHRTTGGAGNSATTPHLIAVAAVDPFSGWRDHYLYEAFTNSGPQCQEVVRLDVRRIPSSKPRCFQQPAFVVPDRLTVVMPEGAGQRREPFIGSSAAGAAAAAVAALLRSARVSSEKLVELLEQTAISQTDTKGWNAHYGYGLIDADAAAVAAGVLAPANTPDNTRSTSDNSLRGASRGNSRRMFERANRGDQDALASLTGAANSGDTSAQTWLAMYLHGVGNDPMAAKWALAAADHGEPAAQGFLGSMYNRGWGLPEDPRAAQAWWLRAARAGLASAMFNLGTTMAHGRGSPTDLLTGFALMRASVVRGLEAANAEVEVAEVQARLAPQQLRAVKVLVVHYAKDPGAIPEP